MAKSELEAGSVRLAKKFASTAGLFLGAMNPRTQEVLKPELISSIGDQFLMILKKGFSESECEQIIYAAHKDKKKEPVPSRLFLGRVPIEQRRSSR